MSKKMKRVNIHLDENWLSELDAIADKIKGSHRGYFMIAISRADVIRFAISQMYGFEYHSSAISQQGMTEAVKGLKIKKQDGGLF